MAVEHSDVLLLDDRSTSGLLLQRLHLLDNYPPSIPRPLGDVPPHPSLLEYHRLLSVRCYRLDRSTATVAVPRRGDLTLTIQCAQYSFGTAMVPGAISGIDY